MILAALKTSKIIKYIHTLHKKKQRPLHSSPPSNHRFSHCAAGLIVKIAEPFQQTHRLGDLQKAMDSAGAKADLIIDPKKISPTLPRSLMSLSSSLLDVTRMSDECLEQKLMLPTVNLQTSPWQWGFLPRPHLWTSA